MSTEPALPKVPDWHLQTLLRLGDDALILAQRVSEWCGHGPALEEDLAMANIGLDLIGQARMLLAHAGQLEGLGRDEDRLAFFRDSAAFRNHSLVELPNGSSRHDDYAITIVRNWLCAARTAPMWDAMRGSTDPQLAAIAAKAVKEAIGHLRHSRDWLIRLGDGTDESHQRMQQALNRLWPYTREFWVDDDIDREAARHGLIAPSEQIFAIWDGEVTRSLALATLDRPADPPFVPTGKQGRHTEYLDYVLAEMQSLARAHPDAVW